MASAIHSINLNTLLTVHQESNSMDVLCFYYISHSGEKSAVRAIPKPMTVKVGGDIQWEVVGNSASAFLIKCSVY